jgi:hypothetical protein
VSFGCEFLCDICAVLGVSELPASVRTFVATLTSDTYLTSKLEMDMTDARLVLARVTLATLSLASK